MLVKDAHNLLVSKNFSLVEKKNSNDYTYHIYRLKNLFIILEETSKYELGGKVNNIAMSGLLVNNDKLDEWDKYPIGGFAPFQKDQIFKLHNSLHPVRGLKCLSSVINMLLNADILSPTKEVNYWNEDASAMISLV